MILQNWWITTLAGLQFEIAPPLKADIEADVLIIGGGMTGVSAAMEFIGKGLKVVLLEQNILGGSTTGRSAGFLTPDSELELAQLERRFGVEGAKEIWEVPCKGIESIIANIKDHNISCDLIKQDSLFEYP
jgi:gamma-glutamylputrescine oxidase